MADWATISSIATAGGTLVLAFATYSAVRSSNRSARIAERSLLLACARCSSPRTRTTRPRRCAGATASRDRVPAAPPSVEVVDDVVYLAIALRNVGAGLAVLQGWHVSDRARAGDEDPPDPGGVHAPAA